MVIGHGGIGGPILMPKNPALTFAGVRGLRSDDMRRIRTIPLLLGLCLTAGAQAQDHTQLEVRAAAAAFPSISRAVCATGPAVWAARAAGAAREANSAAAQKA